MERGIPNRTIKNHSCLRLLEAAKQFEKTQLPTLIAAVRLLIVMKMFGELLARFVKLAKD